MNLFPDTSFLCSLYRRQEHSEKAIRFMQSVHGPLPVSTLLLLEFRQSVRFQIRLHQYDRQRGFSKHEGEEMLRDLQTDLHGGVLCILSADWAEVHHTAESLSARYTEANGHRLADILHVATALHIGADTFLTFDTNQKQLAEAEGMHVPG